MRLTLSTGRHSAHTVRQAYGNSMSRFDPDHAIYLIIDIARLARALFERRVAEAGIGITPAEARVLASLARCGPVRQNHLAERLGVAKMSMTAFLDRLEAAGLVRRAGDPVDRRAKIVTLTDAAEQVLGALSGISVEIGETAKGAMPDGEWQDFKATAHAVRANLSAEKRRDCVGSGT